MGTVVCASCGSAYAEVRRFLFAGICDTCLESHLSSGTRELSDLLERLESPAALVGRDLVVLHANTRLKKLADELDAVGLRVGEALNCASVTPDTRCGETFLCLQCGIRRFLDLARITGERVSNVPVAIGSRSGDAQRFTLTAEGTGDTVLFLLEPGARQPGATA